MKKFINKASDFVAESIAGFAAAHASRVTLNLHPTYLERKVLTPGKVALVSGGGSGHEPLHAGFIGQGMLDAACPGEIFTAPTPDQMMAAAKAVDTGAGVLFIVKNYPGDMVNFEMASDVSDLATATVLINDDVAVESSSYTTGRRGLAGAIVVQKLVGSLAESGASLEQCKAFGDHVNRSTASMGIALTSCIDPSAGTPTFEIGENEVEIGVGIHGEPGRRRGQMMPADALTAELLQAIWDDLEPKPDAEILLIVNGLGATPISELYLLFNCASKWFSAKKINVCRSLVGNYTTALEMAGASFTVCVLDKQMKEHWDHPVNTATLRW